MHEFLTFHIWSRVDLADTDWDNLGFGLVPTDYMYVMKCTQNGTFTEGKLQPYGPVELSPSSGVLNYGQVSMQTGRFVLE